MVRLGSLSPPPIEIDSIMKKSQTRVWKTLQGEPGIDQDFGGFVLKYVGDAVLAFFVVDPGHETKRKVTCTHLYTAQNACFR